MQLIKWKEKEFGNPAAQIQRLLAVAFLIY